MHYTHNFKSLFIWIHLPHGVIASALLLTRRSCADASRTKSCSGTIWCWGVVGEAKNGDVKRLLRRLGLCGIIGKQMFWLHTLLWDAARHLCHSRWANVTGWENGRSTSRSIVCLVSWSLGHLAWLTFYRMTIFWADIQSNSALQKKR